VAHVSTACAPHTGAPRAHARTRMHARAPVLKRRASPYAVSTYPPCVPTPRTRACLSAQRSLRPRCGNSHCGPHVPNGYYAGRVLIGARDKTMCARVHVCARQKRRMIGKERPRDGKKEGERESRDEKGTGRGPFQRMRF